MKTSASLSYQILSCSSEDPSHPIISIISSSLHSSGWHSAPGARFPIEIVIDLMNLVELDTLQFVSHQFKIATRIDLYVSGPDMQFKALGSFTFSDNSHTQYTSRELKSASLNGIKAQYIRILIPGCHSNQNNPSNQVGLISFNVLGRGGVPKSSNPPSKSQGSEISSSLDMLDQLEKQKKEAVSQEDFKRAEQLKRQIDRLRRAYDQISALQAQKKEAIAQEDYVTAQKLKNEIDYLLNGEKNRESNSNPISNQPKPIEYPDERPIPKKNPVPPKENNPPPSKKLPPVEKIANDMFIDDDLPPVKSKPPASNMYNSDDKPIRGSQDRGMKATKGFDEERPIKPAKDDDDSKGPAQSKDEMNTTPDELNPNNKIEAGILVELFGDAVIAMFFSKAWNLKVDGIKKICELICGLKNQKLEAFSRFCHVLRHRIAEDHKAVFSTSLDSLKMCTDTLKLSPQDLSRSYSQFMPQLALKVGCTQLALSKMACKFLLWMADKGCHDQVIPVLLRPTVKPNQWKIPLAQIQTLHKLILAKGEYSSIPGLTLESMMVYIVSNFESPNDEVRKACIDIVVTLEMLAGSVINRYLDKLPQRLKENIDKEIQNNRKQAEGQ